MVLYSQNNDVGNAGHEMLNSAARTLHFYRRDRRRAAAFAPF